MNNRSSSRFQITLRGTPQRAHGRSWAVVAVAWLLSLLLVGWLASRYAAPDAGGLRERLHQSEVQARHGAVDLLVNNAGAYRPGQIASEDDDALLDMLQANLFGAYRLTRRVLPAMMARRSGMVLNAWQQDGQLWLTAVLPKDTEADASFRLKQEEGSRLALQPLPSSLTE